MNDSGCQSQSATVQTVSGASYPMGFDTRVLRDKTEVPNERNIGQGIRPGPSHGNE